MFIPANFWQPDRDQWKTWMALGAVVLAAANMALMRIIWVRAFGFQDVTYKRLARAHRAFGYTAFGIMLFIAVVTCIGIVGYGGYAKRPTWHSYLGITALAMMGIKIFAVRKGLPEGPRFRRWAIGISLLATTALAIMASRAPDPGTALVLPFFPFAALIGFVLWRRFGPLPVVGTGMALTISLLFVSSGGWWFWQQGHKGERPNVEAALALSGNADAGAGVYYSAGCASCHGDKGFGGVGPSLRSAAFAYRNTPRTIAQQVRGGGGGMPAFGQSQITDQQLASLVAFVRNWYQR